VNKALVLSKGRAMKTRITELFGVHQEVSTP